MSLRNLQILSAITSNLGNVVYQDITDSLPKNPKNTWAQLAGVRAIEELTTIVLHHDAYPKKNTINYSDMQLMTKIATEHINNTAYDVTGEGGIPYHIFIRNGRVYQVNDLLDRTYGVASNNAYTVHIVVSGDYFNYDVLTDADRNALYTAILMVINVLPNYKEIKAHKELNATDCPGYDYVKVKNDIQTIQYKMQQQDTWAAKMKNVADIINQINYLTDRMKLGEKDGDAIWAANAFSDVADMMRSKHLL